MTAWVLAAVMALVGATVEEPEEHWRLVYRDGRVEIMDGPLDLSAIPMAELRHAWYWSSQAGPRKIPHGELDQTATIVDRDRLRFLIASDSTRQHPRMRVIAAPLAMWDEVPEDLLPSWPVPETAALSIPSGSRVGWRARLVAEKAGTWWREPDPGQRSTTLRPTSAESLQLDVVDGDGQPVTGSQLYVVEGSPGRVGPKKHLARYRSEEGSFTIPQLPDAQELTLMVTAGGYVPAALRGFPHSLPRRVRLDRGAVVRGRFVGPDEVPVADVTVEVETSAGENFPSFLTLQAKGDATGRWEIEAVPPREATLVAIKRGFAPLIKRLDLKPGTTDLGDLPLKPSVALRVIVTNDLDEAVEAAEMKPPTRAIAITDRDGKATLEGISASASIEIEIDAPGHLPTTTILRPPHPEVTPIRIQRAFEANGRFFDSNGAPVQRGTVLTKLGRQTDLHTLDDAGQFELKLAPGKAYELMLRSPKTRQLRVRLKPGAPGETRDLGDLIAPEGLVLSGRLLSGVDGAPVVGARVWTPRPSAGGPLVAWFYRDLLEARSRTEGDFELRGLPITAGQLRIDATGFARANIAFQPEPESTVMDLGDIELLPGAEVRVVTEGFDAEGATARLDLGNQWLDVDMLTAGIHDSTATFRDVAPGKATISVVRERELLCDESLEVPADDEEVVVSCRASGLRLSGHVTVGGYPAGSGLLGWLPPGEDAPGIVMTRVSSTGLRRQKVFGGGRPQVDVTVLDGGFFQTDKIRAGSWQVVWQPAGGQTSEPKIVMIPEVEDFEVMLDFSGHGITGIVMDLEDRGVERARVRDLASGSVTFSGADGSFRLIGLTPGIRHLKARHKERSSAVVEVELTADQVPEPIVLILEDQSPTGLPLRVLDASSRPIAGALIFAEGEGLGQRILTTGDDGGVDLVLDPPHPKAIRFATFGNQIWTLGGWMPWPEESAEPLVIRQGNTGSLLVEATEGAEDAYLQIVSADGWDLSWLLTRMGLRPMLRGAHLHRFSGLPSGTYELNVDAQSIELTIEIGHERRIALPYE